MTQKTARVHAHYTVKPQPQQPREYVIPWWAVALALAALVTMGAMIGRHLVPLPLCHEDETLTRQGTCVAYDDADYVGGTGWVTVK